ncbi:MAG: glycogen/starch synthase [Phycisphaerales bacterium]|nr:glycogen/starch synthase [Phycisphaerales bacterium]
MTSKDHFEIIHVAAECYPVAKVGGLADVVGSLPKFQKEAGHTVKVIMPAYRTPFFYENKFHIAFTGKAHIGDRPFDYVILKEESGCLGFDLYLIDIEDLLARSKVYGYADDSERFIAFQIAVSSWLHSWNHQSFVVHCHDHHTALLPFFFKHALGLKTKLYSIPTVLTIHNAQYQGIIDWGNSRWLPEWDMNVSGLLDWNSAINSLACGIKCAWAVTTVSPSYLDELMHYSNGLETLLTQEKHKCLGIINGIDEKYWNPTTDVFLSHHYDGNNFLEGKKANKDEICERYKIENTSRPLFVFIGRLVREKAVDIIPPAIEHFFRHHQKKLNFIIQGTGESSIKNLIDDIAIKYPNHVAFIARYDEKLAHQLYAAGDFLLMPSRIEPCGLNQLYAMKYGTIPIVHNTGGLKDTVTDMRYDVGWGISINNSTVEELILAIGRALAIYSNPSNLYDLQKKCMGLNYSWENSVEKYIALYRSLINI